eukprot:gene3486-3981_t
MDIDQTELISICEELGSWHEIEVDEDVNNNNARAEIKKVFVKGDEALEALIELARLIRRDQEPYRDVYHTLGPWNIVKNKLLPLMATYTDNVTLMLPIVKVLIKLTMPIPPETTDAGKLVDYVHNYKETFVTRQFVHTLLLLLSGPMGRLEITNLGKEDDYAMVELVLTLIRNILHIQDPEQSSQVTAKAYRCHMHEDFITMMNEEHLLELFLVLAQNIQDNKLFKSTSTYAFLLLEIFSSMLKQETPASIWSIVPVAPRAINVDSGDAMDASRVALERDDKPDKLAALMSREKAIRSSMAAPKTSRFVGTYTRVNDAIPTHFNRTLPTAAPAKLIDPTSLASAGLAEHVRGRRPAERAQSQSSTKLKLVIKQWAEQFLDGCYNALMEIVVDSLARHPDATLDSDRLNFLKITAFFTGFALITLQQAADDTEELHEAVVGRLAATLSISTFNFVFSCCENSAPRSLAREAAITTLKEMVSVLHYMALSTRPELASLSMSMQSNIYYNRDVFLGRVVELMRSYDRAQHPLAMLNDLTDLSYTAVHMVERFCELHKNITIKRRHKKKSKRLDQDDGADAEEDAKALPSDEGFIDDGKEPAPKASPTDDVAHAEEGVGKEDGDEEKKVETVAATPDEGDEEKEESAQEDSEDEDEGHMDGAMSFISFLSDFAHPDIVKNLCSLLGNYHSNTDKTNYQIVALLKRIINDLELEPMLYRLSTFYLFKNLLTDATLQKDPKAQEMLELVKQVVNNYFKLVENNETMLLEILVPRTRHNSYNISEYHQMEQENLSLPRSERKQREEEYDRGEAHFDSDMEDAEEQAPVDEEEEKFHDTDDEDGQRVISLQSHLKIEEIGRAIESIMMKDHADDIMVWIKGGLLDAIIRREGELDKGRFSSFHFSTTNDKVLAYSKTPACRALFRWFNFRPPFNRDGLFSIPEDKLHSPTYLSFLHQKIKEAEIEAVKRLSAPKVNKSKKKQKEQRKKKKVESESEEEEEEQSQQESESEKSEGEEEEEKMVVEEMPSRSRLRKMTVETKSDSEEEETQQPEEEDVEMTSPGQQEEEEEQVEEEEEDDEEAKAKLARKEERRIRREKKKERRERRALRKMQKEAEMKDDEEEEEEKPAKVIVAAKGKKRVAIEKPAKVVVTPKKKVITKKPAKVVSESEEEEDESEEEEEKPAKVESESESEEEEEEEEKIPIITKKPAKVVSESESEEEEEEEEKPIITKKPAKVESESESEEEEEEEKPIITKKVDKKQTKVVSESESEDEEEKPIITKKPAQSKNTPKVVSTPKGKKAVVVQETPDVQSSSESEEEEKPIITKNPAPSKVTPKVAAAIKGKKAVVVQETPDVQSSSESDEEEEKSAKVTVAAKGKKSVVVEKQPTKVESESESEEEEEEKPAKVTVAAKGKKTVVVEKPAKVVVTPKKIVTKQPAKVVSESEEEEEESEEEKSVVTKKKQQPPAAKIVVAPTTTKTKKIEVKKVDAVVTKKLSKQPVVTPPKVESSSDEEDDDEVMEEVKPVAKPVKKIVKVTLTPKGKKNIKKPVVQSDSDDSEQEEEEEVRPAVITKPVKKMVKVTLTPKGKKISAAERKKKAAVPSSSGESEQEEEEEQDEPIVTKKQSKTVFNSKIVKPSKVDSSSSSGESEEEAVVKKPIKKTVVVTKQTANNKKKQQPLAIESYSDSEEEVAPAIITKKQQQPQQPQQPKKKTISKNTSVLVKRRQMETEDDEPVAKLDTKRLRRVVTAAIQSRESSK